MDSIARHSTTRQEKPNRRTEPKPFSIHRVVYERELGPPYRSRRFATEWRARRFYELLLKPESEARHGRLLFVAIERADGVLGPWRFVTRTGDWRKRTRKRGAR